MTHFLAVLSALTCCSAGPTVIFEDDFDAYGNSEVPSSIAEIRKTPWRFGEVIDGRYAINHGGNQHQLVMPRVSDFELTFTADPHPRAPFAPILIISFRLTGRGINAASARVTCEKHYEDVKSPEGSRTLRLELGPDEVVPMIISGLE